MLKAGGAAEPDAIIAFAKEHMAAYKYPRVVHLVDDLPLGPSGKVLKRELTARYAAKDPAAEPASA